MLKLVQSGEDMGNSGSMRLYVTERNTEFTCVDDKALQSCVLNGIEDHLIEQEKKVILYSLKLVTLVFNQ